MLVSEYPTKYGMKLPFIGCLKPQMKKLGMSDLLAVWKKYSLSQISEKLRFIMINIL